MRKSIILTAATATLLGLAACSDEAATRSEEAANAIAVDTQQTMGQAINDLEAATDAALGSAERGIDRMGQSIENGVGAARESWRNETAPAPADNTTTR